MKRKLGWMEERKKTDGKIGKKNWQIGKWKKIN